ncbi:aldose 1-epimerase family protein [Proteiniclasticum sp. BAD-10]|uniref:Aldose 1-epimerase family protein n=1 Tax=Proteiniclasticum sediminis TaxID=2804028 RepID=A0A941CRT7_9CLOT|nr:aldose 1-epimerase family protein [Proteiniclasticum sediminis]MBR0577052.1 aldose 1-epimerase family protein [Proteiniclasticum sediminis]
MVHLKNEHLTVDIGEAAAEMTSLKDREEREYLLRDTRYWGYSSPVLFPVVGSLAGGVLRHEGNTFPLKRHGFARNHTFTVVSATEDTARLRLTSTPETLTTFPFPFQLDVLYTLKGQEVLITYEVTNPGKSPLPYSIGAHPAFWTTFAPEGFSAYTLEFEQPERLSTLKLNLENGLLLEKEDSLGENTRFLKLEKAIFQEDALVFRHLKSRHVTLTSPQDPRRVRVHIEGFPFLGIWTTPGDAPFICVEPWFGHADFEGFTGDFLNKPDNEILLPGETRTYTHRIEIL